MPQDRRRAVEWKVRDHAERLRWERNTRGVAEDDVHALPAAPQMFHPAQIELDRDHTSARGHERTRQPAAARAEIEDEIALADTGVAHELGRQGPGAKEMLATCAARPARTSRAPLGHGPSP